MAHIRTVETGRHLLAINDAERELIRKGLEALGHLTGIFPDSTLSGLDELRSDLADPYADRSPLSRMTWPVTPAQSLRQLAGTTGTVRVLPSGG